MVIITGFCVYLANIMKIHTLFSSSVPDIEMQSTLVLSFEGQMTLRRVPLVEQGLLTIPDHLRSPPSSIEYELWCSIFKGTIYAYTPVFVLKEEFEDTKGLIRIRKSKDRQHNGQKKKDKQRSTKQNT